MKKINGIGYRLVKNHTQTAEVAPYTALPVPVGSLALDNILTKMLERGTFMTKATAQYILMSFYEYAAKAIGENAVRISIGTVSLYPAISGSFPSEDAEFDETRNKLYVGASFSQSLRDSVAGIQPSYLGDPTDKSTVALASVMDLASKTMGVIDGTNPFRLAGVNLTVPDGADESLALYTKDVATKVCDITVSENDGGLYLKCALPTTATVAKGAYRIRLASHGIDPSDPLAIVTLPVTLVRAVTPTPIYTSTLGGTHIYSGVTTAGDKLPTDDLHVTGADDVLVLTGDAKPTNPENPTTGIASTYLTGCGEENIPLTPVYDAAAGTMTLKLGLAMFQLDPGTYENAKISFLCYKDGQTDSLEIAKKIVKA